MMKAIPLALIAGALVSAAALAAPQSIIQPGVWRTDDGSSTVRIANCRSANTQCATVIAERLEPGQTSSLGQALVQDIRPNEKKGWVGKFVADNQLMNAKISSAGQGRMKVKICAIPVLCDTINMVRISD